MAKVRIHRKKPTKRNPYILVAAMVADTESMGPMLYTYSIIRRTYYMLGFFSYKYRGTVAITDLSHERTRITGFPKRRLVEFKVVIASSSVEISPIFIRNRPSRTRWTISVS